MECSSAYRQDKIKLTNITLSILKKIDPQLNKKNIKKRLNLNMTTSIKQDQQHKRQISTGKKWKEGKLGPFLSGWWVE